MTYTPTTWVDGVTTLGPTNLNKIEQGLAAVANGSIPAINVKGSGAVGDGVTDDTAALQAAINAGSAQTLPVSVPPGTYVVSSLTVPDAGYVALLGWPGAVFRHAAGSQNPILYRAQGQATTSELRVAGIKFQGNGYDAQTTVNGTQNGLSNGSLLVGSTTGFTASGQFIVGNTQYTYTSKDATHLIGVTGSFTAGATVSQEVIKSAIYCTAVNDVRIQDCEFDGFMSAVIGLYGCRRYWVARNTITNSTSAGGRNAIHIDVDFSDASNAAKMGDGLIHNNFLDTGQTGGIVVTTTAGANTLRDRVVISGNIVRNFPSWCGIALEAGYIHSASVVANQVYGCSVGITVDKADASFAGQETNQYKVIANNLIDSLGVTGTYGGKGITVVGRNLNVTGNTIRSAGHGIQIDRSASGNFAENIACTGNSIVIANANLALTPVGITVSNSRSGVIAGNSITRESTSDGMTDGIYAQFGSALQITANVVRQVGRHGIYLYNGQNDTDVFGNRVTDCNQQNLSGDCIRVENACVRVRVKDNTLVDTGTATPALADLYSVNPTSTNIHYENNIRQGVAGLSTDTAASVVTNRGNRVASTKAFASGVSAQTPGAVTTVNIAHGLGVAPRAGGFHAQPAEANARGAPAYFVTADATNLILTFASALTAATSYSWNWSAEA